MTLDTSGGLRMQARGAQLRDRRHAHDVRDQGPRRDLGFSRRALRGPRGLGPARLPHADLLPRGRQGRALRGLGAARALHPRDARRFSIPQVMAMDTRTANISGLELFYREAGDPSQPTLVLLHGFPTSSYQFHDLIPRVADRFHVIAPDFPGMGYSEVPAPTVLRPTFDDVGRVVDAFLAQHVPGPLILSPAQRVHHGPLGSSPGAGEGRRARDSRGAVART